MSDNKSLSELYSNNTIIRALVQTIPTLGSIIDAFLAMPGTKYRDARLESFLNCLYESMKVLEFKVDALVVETEEFHDCLWMALKSSLNSRNKDKIIMNVMILSNILTIRNDDSYQPEEYLKILSELSPIESKIVAIFHQVHNEQIKPQADVNENIHQSDHQINTQELVAETLKMDQAELLFYYKRLEGMGLLSEITGSFLGYMGGLFVPSRTLDMLMKYLEKHPFSKMNL